MHVLVKLLSDLRRIVRGDSWWGQPLGSSQLWGKHVRTIDRIDAIASSIRSDGVRFLFYHATFVIILLPGDKALLINYTFVFSLIKRKKKKMAKRRNPSLRTFRKSAFVRFSSDWPITGTCYRPLKPTVSPISSVPNNASGNVLTMPTARFPARA